MNTPPINNATITCKRCRRSKLLQEFMSSTNRQFRTCYTCDERDTPEPKPPATLLMLNEVPHYFLDSDEVGLTVYTSKWTSSWDMPFANSTTIKSEKSSMCGRVFGFINRKCNWINLNVVHHLDHERPEDLEARMIRSTPIPVEIRDYISTQINLHDLNATNLYEKVVGLFGYVVNRGQVSNAWRNAFVASYKKHEDQLESSRLLVQSLGQDADCEVLMFRSTNDVKYSGFETGFFDLLVQSDQVTEYHVDSTYKTNRAGFELFGVVANVYGSGYPIAYLIVKVDSNTNASGEDTGRITALKTFFQEMKDRGFNPTFFFTDKDQAEINAIEATCPSDGPSIVRLCLWHLKRAVKLKLSKPKTAILPIYNEHEAHLEYDFVDVSFVPVEDARIRGRNLMTTVNQRAVILDMMGKYYNMHHFIPEGTNFYASNEAIRHRSAEEMYRYCYENRLQDTWAYLYRNWYTKTAYDRWAKSGVANKVPIGKTMMMIEAHWKVLKRTHLYHYNRARLDLVTFVILKHYYAKLKIKYQSMVVYRSETSTFESHFMKEWIKGRGAQVSGTVYSTDLVRWVCGCPSFLHSPVTLCKHLVKAYIADTHDDLVNRRYFIQRSHTPPFINFLPTTNPNTYHPGNHPREGLRPRPTLRRRLSEVDGGTALPDRGIPRGRTNQPVPPQQQSANVEAIPVVDEERNFLAHEVRYRDKRANARRLRELLARAEEEEEEEKGQYMTLLNNSSPPQAADFARAIEDGNEDCLHRGCY